MTALVLILGLVAGGSAADLITGTAAGPVVGGSGGSSFTGGTLTSDTTAAAGFCFVVGTNGGKICQKTEGTPDQSGLFTGTTGNAWLIAESADYAFDFAHAAATDPTLFIHSHNQNTTQWLGLTHNGTDGVISSGAGKILMTPVSASSVQITSTNAAALILNPTAGFDGLQLLGQYATIINATTGWQIQGTGYQTQTSAIALEPGTANSVQIYEYADRTFDFAHGAQTDPTLFIHSHNQSTTQWIGLSHNGANGAISTGLGPVALASGSIVASASALPLPTGNVFHVSGTTSITSITTTALSAGMTITLIFDGTLAGSGFVDGNNLKLAGNFAANADDTITLAYDGTNFYEVARAAN